MSRLLLIVIAASFWACPESAVLSPEAGQCAVCEPEQAQAETVGWTCCRTEQVCLCRPTVYAFADGNTDALQDPPEAVIVRSSP